MEAPLSVSVELEPLVFAPVRQVELSASGPELLAEFAFAPLELEPAAPGELAFVPLELEPAAPGELAFAPLELEPAAPGEQASLLRRKPLVTVKQVRGLFPDYWVMS